MLVGPVPHVIKNELAPLNSEYAAYVVNVFLTVLKTGPAKFVIMTSSAVGT
jgi:hypothetical protein